MIRPRNRKAQEDIVKTLIDIIENEINPKFGKKMKISHMHIHKQFKNKYCKNFIRIINYLETLRGNNKNTLSSLIRDYLMVAYRYYQQFGRTPTLLQLSPSTSNRIRFEEYIIAYERNNKEDYWLHFRERPPEIIEVPIEKLEMDVNIIET